MNVKIADRIKLGVTIVVSAIMVYALYVSRDHITHVAHLIGLSGYQAETLFVLVDIPAIVGKALQTKYFAASTRKVGKRLMIASGLVSLGCNVASGWFSGGYGPAGYGVFVVAMFLIMENVVTKIKPAASVTRVKNGNTIKAPRKRAPRKAVAARTPKASTTTTAPASSARV